jgi:hypothetical protein
VACTLACLVAADLVGVVACFFCDAFLSERRTSGALYYAIWFVLGVFCGLCSYLTCVDIVSPEKRGDFRSSGYQVQTGVLVVLTTTVVLLILSILFYRIQWQYSMADSVYVPDSEPLTATFFVTVLASVIFTHKNLRPEPKSRK